MTATVAATKFAPSVAGLLIVMFSPALDARADVERTHAGQPPDGPWMALGHGGTTELMIEPLDVGAMATP